MSTNQAYIARGNISPCTIVKGDTATDFGALACGANGIAIGIAQEGSKAAPIPSASALAAASGDPIRIFGPGEQCLLVLGGTVAAQDKLISDASGAGVTVGAYSSSTPQYVIAIAQQAGVAGEKIQVEVVEIVF